MPSRAVSGGLLTRQFVAGMWTTFAGRLGEADAAVALRRLDTWRRIVLRSLGPASGVIAIHDVATAPLLRILGFEVLRTQGTPGDVFVLSVASARRTGAIPCVTGPWATRLDTLVRTAIEEAIGRGARWALCVNGTAIRVVDADRPYARRGLEIDLGAAAGDIAAGRVLWAVLRARALAREPAARDAGLALLAAASDAEARHVADALQLGVQAALDALASKLRLLVPRRRAPAGAIVDEALTVVCRLLFLLFAEARALVPVWNPIYRRGYSVDALRESCAREPGAAGLWAALQAMSRLAHAGCRRRDLRVTAFNSQLFSPAGTTLLDRTRIDDHTMTRVLRALTGAAVGAPPVAYGDLGVEQLGSVYERVLDFVPVLEEALSQRGRARRAPDTAVARGGGRRGVSTRRKESGTFYTPRPMATYLVRCTLAPLVDGASSDAILRLRVVDPAMGSGAFLVAACRYLADAYLAALEREGQASPDRGRDARGVRARCRRLIAQRCLYGVDANPVAVQLARVSLWLATLSGDEPLTFLDHHLCAGDSLVGASLDDLRRGWREPRREPRRPGHASLPFGDDEVGGLMRGLLPTRMRLAGPDDTAAAVRGKERALAQSLTHGALARWLALADLWCARWFWPAGEDCPPPRAWHELADHLVRGTSSLPRLAPGWLAQAGRAGAARRFLHWPLRFPEVFFDEEGLPRRDAGFDAVIGNPPWDMIRGDARGAAARAQKRGDAAALTRFVREAGVYPRPGSGHLNRYQLFVSRALALARDSGRLGLVVPWGLLGDAASAGVRRSLFERCSLEAVLGLENGDGLFPIHRSVRFALFTATTGRVTQRTSCRLGARSMAAFERPVPSAATPGEPPPVSVTPSWLRRVSGDGLDVPYVRDARDLALLDRIVERCPALSHEEGWQVTFGRELNATDDRPLFRAGGRGMRVVAGRHLVPFAVGAERPEDRVIAAAGEEAVLARLPRVRHARLGYRDVASASNRVTLIAAIVPARVVCTHTVFTLRERRGLDAQCCLMALFNSLVANYLVRLRVTTHVTVAHVSRLPMPCPDPSGGAFAELAGLACEIAGAAGSTDATGRGRGLAAIERLPAWPRVQALAARAYGLAIGEFEYILSTFPLVDAGARARALAALRSL